MEILNGSLFGEFVASHQDYSDLFDIVSSGAIYEQPEPLRRELIFYFGHTVAFTRKKLIQAGADLSSHPFDNLFERGVSPDSAEALDSFDRVDIDEVVRYRKRFVQDVARLFEQVDLRGDGIAYALKMGIEHENLHLQTTYPHICKLDHSKKLGSDSRFVVASDLDKVELSFIDCDGGDIRLGRGEYLESVGNFMWDNEQGRQIRKVEPFEVSKYPITNTQVLEFIREGGYQDDSLWEGVFDFEGHVSRIRDRGMPFNFEMRGRELVYRTLRDTLSNVPLAWPAMLNRYEANAMARFFGGRPISEAEWHILHHGHVVKFENGRYVPRDVRGYKEFSIGDIACWTNDDFRPLTTPGDFRVSSLYEDFSTEWFNQKHGLIKGASFMGRGVMLNLSFRDFMQNMMDYPASTYVVRSYV